MYLLDIIVDYPHRPVHPVKPVIPPDTAKVPAEVPDTVIASDTVLAKPVEVPDTAAVQDWLVGTPGDDSSMLLWGALIVVAALALCLLLARSYRRRLNTVR